MTSSKTGIYGEREIKKEKCIVEFTDFMERHPQRRVQISSLLHI